MIVPAGALNYVRPDDDGIRARGARRAAVRLRRGGLSRASVGRGGRFARGEGPALHPAGPRQRPDSAARRSRGIRRRRGRRRSSGTGDPATQPPANRPTSCARSSASFCVLPTSTTERTGFPPASGDPGDPVRSSRFAADIMRRNCDRPSKHRIPRSVFVRPQKILIAYGKAVLVQFEGLATATRAERRAI